MTKGPDLPRIAVFSLGGTIAMTGSGRGVLPTLAAADLIQGVPGLDGVAALEARAIFAAPSIDLTYADIAKVADAIRAAFAAGVDGVVVTQGTDTLEETAFLLDLLLEAGAPVVVTGAMRNPSLAGADGPANLLAASPLRRKPPGLGWWWSPTTRSTPRATCARCTPRSRLPSPRRQSAPWAGSWRTGCGSRCGPPGRRRR